MDHDSFFSRATMMDATSLGRLAKRLCARPWPTAAAACPTQKVALRKAEHHPFLWALG
jgi:hypothetical protein